MLPFESERVRANVREATTEDLLDRVTVYRAGMEPEALDIIEAELRRRGIRPETVADHGSKRTATIIPNSDGTAVACSFCDRPAVVQAWGWQRLWGVVPVFPRRFAYCADHRPGSAEDEPRP